MTRCSGNSAGQPRPSPCCGRGASQDQPQVSRPSGPLAWFHDMIQHCYQHAQEAKAQGRPIVGILCEYTPRELILAAGGVPVCLCGGSAEMISPAEEHLPANLCPLIKSTYGYSVKQANPFLEMADLIVAETTCDGKKKMYELMAQTRPVYVLELPQKPTDNDAMDHWVAELRKLKAELERRFHVEITDERVREAIRTMNRERGLRRQLADLMQSANPPLTGRQLLELKSSISGIAADLDQYAKALDLFGKTRSANGKSLSQNLFRGEIEREAPGQGGRRKRPGGVLEGTSRTFFADNAAPGVSQPIAAERGSEIDSKVRVLMTGVPMVHGAERVLDIIESAGGLVVAMDNCTGLKPIWEDVEESADDPILALARKYLRIPCSVMTPNDRRMEVLREMVKAYRPQCIVDLIWQACLTYDVESHRVRQLAQELGLPFQRIETDYSPSDSARIALRIEALFETVRQKRTEGVFGHE